MSNCCLLFAIPTSSIQCALWLTMMTAPSKSFTACATLGRCRKLTWFVGSSITSTLGLGLHNIQNFQVLSWAWRTNTNERTKKKIKKKERRRKKTNSKSKKCVEMEWSAQITTPALVMWSKKRRKKRKNKRGTIKTDLSNIKHAKDISAFWPSESVATFWNTIPPFNMKNAAVFRICSSECDPYEAACKQSSTVELKSKLWKSCR